MKEFLTELKFFWPNYFLTIVKMDNKSQVSQALQSTIAGGVAGGAESLITVSADQIGP